MSLEQYQETGRRTPTFGEDQHISYKEELRLHKARQERINNKIAEIKTEKQKGTWSNTHKNYIENFSDELIEKEIEFTPYI